MEEKYISLNDMRYLKNCPDIWYPAENIMSIMRRPYEAGHYKTILLLSDEPMNVRRTKAYEANSKYSGRFISAERACRR